MKITRKAYGYITHGNRLLVFEHVDFPEAGIQIPGGSIEADETPEQGALRESFEETGLENLSLVGFVGYYERDMSEYGRDEIQQCWVYHLRCDDPTPQESWLHVERFPSEGDYAEITFRLYWVNLLDGLPDLAGMRGEMLNTLVQMMGLRE